VRIVISTRRSAPSATTRTVASTGCRRRAASFSTARAALARSASSTSAWWTWKTMCTGLPSSAPDPNVAAGAIMRR
jgi:hypothetical protein